MASSTHRIGSSENTDRLYSPNPASKLKTFGFAIAIIIGIGGLAVGGVGIVRYFGAISNLHQVHAIIMMAAGGGAILIGLVGVKNCRNNTSEDISGSRAHQPVQVNREEIIHNRYSRWIGIWTGCLADLGSGGGK
jgi:hypothetical protein